MSQPPSSPPDTTEPLTETRIGDTPITLLGTAHVSRKSAETVRELIESGRYGVIAVELCPSRHHALSNPEALAHMDLMQVFREGKAAMVAANLAMGAYQQRLAEQYGIEPGAEMRAAMAGAEAHALPLELIDREIGITLRRTAANLGWWKRLALFSGLLVGLVSREEVDEKEIERLKEGDMLEAAFAEFAQDRQDLYEPLIAERDRYMAAKLALVAHRRPGRPILAVVGAGHLKGIAEQLPRQTDPEAEIARLDTLPPRPLWPKVLPWVIVALVLVGFWLGFSKSPELGWQMVGDWVLINGGLSAFGALFAAAHPLTVVTAFLAAPLTSLNPTIGAGMVTAAAELMLRKPQVRDFASLRHDTIEWQGWWRNRVSRTLLVFLFSTLGSVIGTYLAGFRIVERLTG
ncbi:TraB/GumN family protein [endosymbiont of unidentified scaly snail isolate Monju]|uniref:TraB/GumN family protein n=1 Tax=endosymbiont of unidentified scaly snail isolate Monju TaxID=1248727 RepID=UPI0003891E9B|nr:TraB/GumN family protein [endosymbiont of unidentified scaly snail isolate Monju]BAN69867.1 TraB family protein [endosymbiont of unidentified scaly snail isolate Monju]